MAMAILVWCPLVFCLVVSLFCSDGLTAVACHTRNPPRQGNACSPAGTPDFFSKTMLCTVCKARISLDRGLRSAKIQQEPTQTKTKDCIVHCAIEDWLIGLHATASRASAAATCRDHGPCPFIYFLNPGRPRSEGVLHPGSYDPCSNHNLRPRSSLSACSLARKSFCLHHRSLGPGSNPAELRLGEEAAQSCRPARAGFTKTPGTQHMSAEHQASRMQKCRRHPCPQLLRDAR